MNAQEGNLNITRPQEEEEIERKVADWKEYYKVVEEEGEELVCM